MSCNYIGRCSNSRRGTEGLGHLGFGFHLRRAAQRNEPNPLIEPPQECFCRRLSIRQDYNTRVTVDERRRRQVNAGRMPLVKRAGKYQLAALMRNLVVRQCYSYGIRARARPASYRALWKELLFTFLYIETEERKVIRAFRYFSESEKYIFRRISTRTRVRARARGGKEGGRKHFFNVNKCAEWLIRRVLYIVYVTWCYNKIYMCVCPRRVYFLLETRKITEGRNSRTKLERTAHPPSMEIYCRNIRFGVARARFRTLIDICRVGAANVREIRGDDCEGCTP